MNHSPAQLRIAAVLGIAAAVAVAAVFPYALALKPDALFRASAALHVPVAAIVVLQALQGGVLCFLLGWAGLKLGAPLGLGAPWLGAWLYRRPQPSISNWWLAALLGVLAAGAILSLIALFGAPIDAPTGLQQSAAWKGLLASPYGGIVEEILLRVFVMGGVAWLLVRATGGIPRPWVMVGAIVIAALLFGVGHLPLAAQMGPLTVPIVTKIIAYNALAGLAFGWLYWKRGLEHAMLAHFCADLVAHVAMPLLAT